MLRGFLSGAAIAALLSAATLGTVSLNLPLPGAPTSTSQVDVPAGSEFKREKPDETPVFPATDPELPDASGAPEPHAPQADSAPALDTSPASRPDTAAAAPERAQGAPADEATAPAPPTASNPVEARTQDPALAPQQPEQDSAPVPPAKDRPAIVATAPTAPTGPQAPPVSTTDPAQSDPAPLPANEGDAPSQTAPAMPAPPQAPSAPTAPEAPPVAPITLPVPDTTAPLPQNPAPTADESDAGAPDSADAPVAEPDPNLPAYQRFAAPFEASSAKPLMAIVLRIPETGAAPLETLSALDIPVTFLLDSEMDGVGEIASALRAEKREIMALLPPLKDAGDAQAVEIALEALRVGVPEAIGYADRASDGIASNRTALKQTLVAMAAEGHGMLLYDRGLNAAQSAAERAGVAAALVFRTLDAESERAHTIRRYLDRAAFKAGQEGQVVMIGHAYPETISAILEWALDGRAEAVTLAPLSATLRR